jgi:hypothetical protein
MREVTSQVPRRLPLKYDVLSLCLAYDVFCVYLDFNVRAYMRSPCPGFRWSDTPALRADRKRLEDLATGSQMSQS